MRAQRFVVGVRRTVLGVLSVILLTMVTLGAELEAQEEGPAVFASIVGRVVSADSLEPLAAASVVLIGCDKLLTCFEFLDFTLTGEDGSFRIQVYTSVLDLGVEHFQLRVESGLHQSLLTELFPVSEGEVFEIGDLALDPVRFIGTVSGRLVDRLDGRPLSGELPLHASATLERCAEFCEILTGILVDSEGRFVVDGVQVGAEVGTFRISGFADQYEPSSSPLFTLGEVEDLDLGDLSLDPWPVQLTDIHPCGDIPAGGGTCRFELMVRNGEETRFSGAVWAIVESPILGSFAGSTRFQLGKVGADNPMPHRFNLASGQQELFEFDFEVPEEVMNGSFFCATVLVGRDPVPQIDTLGERFLFCIFKGVDGFEVVPELKGRKMLESLRRTPLP